MHPYKNTFFKSYGSDKFQAIPAKTCQCSVEYITALELDSLKFHIFTVVLFSFYGISHFFSKDLLIYTYMQKDFRRFYGGWGVKSSSVRGYNLLWGRGLQLTGQAAGSNLSSPPAGCPSRSFWSHSSL